jgi:hypothetical protein
MNEANRQLFSNCALKYSSETLSTDAPSLKLTSGDKTCTISLAGGLDNDNAPELVHDCPIDWPAVN